MCHAEEIQVHAEKKTQKPQIKSRTINELRAAAFPTGLGESFPDFLLALG